MVLKVCVLIANIIGIIALIYHCVKKCKHVSEDERTDDEYAESVDDVELAGTQQTRSVSKNYQSGIYSLYVPSVPPELVNESVCPSVNSKRH